MEAYRQAIKFYKLIVKLTHKQEVCRMYRSALREAFNWSENRDLFLEEAETIRARFDANKNLPEGLSLPLSFIE